MRKLWNRRALMVQTRQLVLVKRAAHFLDLDEELLWLVKPKEEPLAEM